ncbi:MAG: VacJ family lipoprotein, partial [Moraxellaceae bacterium]
MNNSLFRNLSLSLFLVTATTTSFAQNSAPTSASDPFSSTTAQQTQPGIPAADTGVNDPWQGFNRGMFTFNLKADRYLLKPIAKAYVRLTPTFFRRGVHNVLSNVMEVPSAFNGLLQGNVASAAHDTGRLLVNSTIGIAGLFDVAQHMGLETSRDEDFGQTLAVWGVGSGPYIVLPILGPSTLRDTSALPVDWATDPKSYIDHTRTSNAVRGTAVVNARANVLPIEKNIPGDKYLFVRDAYLQNRDFMINNGKVQDSFGA